MAIAHRHAHAGWADLNRVIANDLACLIDHLHLFGGVALMFRRADLRNQIESDRMGKRLTAIVVAGKLGARGLLQVAAACQSGAAGRLVGAHHDALDPRGVMQWLHRHHHLRRRAIRAGDDSLMVVDGLRIYLRYNQGYLRVHAPIAAFVDHDAASLDRPGSKIPRHFVGRAADRQIDPFECLRPEFLDRMFPAREHDFFAGRASRSQKFDPLKREIPLLKQLQNNGSHSAGSAHDGNRIEHRMSLQVSENVSSAAIRRDRSNSIGSPPEL
jgi:hypothetical protein